MLEVAPGGSFPRYTAAELTLDRVLHGLGLLLAAGGIAWLFLERITAGGARQFLAVTIYGAGLIGMFAASAAYNLCHRGRRKELLRRVDHAMIFVMIAGTCTPFALSGFSEGIGLLLCTLIWMVALIGAALKLVFPRRFEGLLLGLCLIMGWTMFGMSRTYADNLSDVVLFLLFGGGVAYSCGAFIHQRSRLPFHNVAWHGLVLLGASLHWAAVANQVMN